ncbi:hypothetical protein PCANC_00140 [Puccinia coronata f. sp. avenae]|nr:hypothetical protein PCANC_00140 [Puccinia coronata f. sp. avenae]
MLGGLDYWRQAFEENRWQENSLGQLPKQGYGEINIWGLLLEHLLQEAADQFMMEGSAEEGADVEELDDLVRHAFLFAHHGLWRQPVPGASCTILLLCSLALRRLPEQRQRAGSVAAAQLETRAKLHPLSLEGWLNRTQRHQLPPRSAITSTNR